MKKYLKQNNLDEKLKQQFEKFDEKNQGILDPSNFKTCLIHMKFGISLNDIASNKVFF